MQVARLRNALEESQGALREAHAALAQVSSTDGWAGSMTASWGRGVIHLACI